MVHFDVVKARSQFAVEPELAHFFQAEVLVPSPLPPHLIVFPDEKARKAVKPAVSKLKSPEGGGWSKPALSGAESSKICETGRSSSTAFTSASSFSTSSQHVAEGEAATSLFSQNEDLSVLDDKGQIVHQVPRVACQHAAEPHNLSLLGKAAPASCRCLAGNFRCGTCESR